MNNWGGVPSQPKNSSNVSSSSRDPDRNFRLSATMTISARGLSESEPPYKEQQLLPLWRSCSKFAILICCVYHFVIGRHLVSSVFLRQRLVRCFDNCSASVDHCCCFRGKCVNWTGHSRHSRHSRHCNALPVLRTGRIWFILHFNFLTYLNVNWCFTWHGVAGGSGNWWHVCYPAWPKREKMNEAGKCEVNHSQWTCMTFGLTRLT
jgi:hypothetical protein